MSPISISLLVILWLTFAWPLSISLSALAIASQLDLRRDDEEEVQHAEYLLEVLTPSHSTRVLLTLTKRKPRKNRIRCKVSLSYPHEHPDPRTASSFLNLPDSNILRANSHLQWLFGQTIVGIDISYHSGWPNMRMARFIEAVQNTIPSLPDYNGIIIPSFLYFLMTLPAFFILSRLPRFENAYSCLAKNICMVLRPGIEESDLSGNLVAIFLCGRVHTYFTMTTQVSDLLWRQLLYKTRYKDKDSKPEYFTHWLAPCYFVGLAWADMRKGPDGLFW